MADKYFAYGLMFESALELYPLKPVQTALSTDVCIRLGDISAKGLDKINESRAFAQVNDSQVWLDIPDICRLLISRGEEIIYQPYEGADEQSIRLYILGSAIGAILHQRGYLVLHANAIRMGQAAVLFSGVSGVGKSTTAAVFHQRGYEVISDDVVAVDDAGRILGGFPQIKLWEDALEHLDIPKQDLVKIRLQINKYSFPVPADFEYVNLPIKAIYFLSVARDQEPGHFSLNQLQGLEKFDHLKAHTYRRHFMEGLGLKPHHMNLCSQIASRVHMAELVRPQDHFNAHELVDFVLEDLSEAGLEVMS